MQEVTGLLMVALVVFLLVLAVCWIVLPFMLIGTKPILRAILAELRAQRGGQPLLPASKPMPVAVAVGAKAAAMTIASVLAVIIVMLAIPMLMFR